MLMQEERELVVEYGKKMSAARLSTGTSGNISIYNAYCHMNAITIKKDNINDVFFNPDKENWHRTFKTLSLIPIIPSFSYTYYF